jgi:hypothetical protein
VEKRAFKVFEDDRCESHGFSIIFDHPPDKTMDALPSHRIFL